MPQPILLHPTESFEFADWMLAAVQCANATILWAFADDEATQVKAMRMWFRAERQWQEHLAAIRNPALVP